MECNILETTRLRCRVCLENSEHTFSLLEELSGKKESISYSQILSSICKFEAENAPRDICRNCAQNAEISYDFKVLCEQSNNILRDEKESSVNVDIEGLADNIDDDYDNNIDDDNDFSETNDDQNEYSRTDDTIDIKDEIEIGEIEMNFLIQESPDNIIDANTTIEINPLQNQEGLVTIQKSNTLQETSILNNDSSLPDKISNISCPMCKQKFTQECVFKEHTLICTKTACPNCEKIYLKKNIKMHLRSCNKVIMCPKCKKNYSVKSVNKHVRTCGKLKKEKGIPCPKCKKIYSVKNLNRHMRICDKLKLKEEKLREEISRPKDNNEKIIQEMNNSEKDKEGTEIVCPKCKKIYLKENLKMHLKICDQKKIQEMKNDEIACPECKKIYLKKNLKSHLRSCNKVIPCPKCKKNYLVKSVNRHVRTCGKLKKEKVIPCPKCKKIYSVKSINTHVRTCGKLKLKKEKVREETSCPKDDNEKIIQEMNNSEKDKVGTEIVCLKCKKIYIKENPKMHFKICNQEIKDYEIACPECNRIYPKTYIKKHLWSCKKEIPCPKCKNNYLVRNLRRHMSICDELKLRKEKQKEVKKQFANKKRESDLDSDLSEDDNEKNKLDFVCLMCEKKFLLKQDLIEHLLHCEADVPEFCEACDYKPVSSKDYVEHHKIHPTTNKVTYCMYCSFQLSPTEYRTHLIEIHKDKKLGCDYCDLEIFHLYIFNNHMREFHPKEILNCKFCDFKTDTYMLYSKHLKDEHKDIFPEKKCKWCDFETNDRRCMTLHVEEKHNDKKTFKCKLCGTKFFTRVLLNRHMRVIHMEEKIECKVCQKYFGEQSLLKDHMSAIHPDFNEVKSLERIICEKCGVTFISTNSYKQHKKKCSKKRFPEKCVNCDYKPISSLDYYTHKKTEHTQNTTNICIYCDYNYSTDSTYRKHLAMKHPEKKHCCEYCKYPSYTPRSYFVHMGRKHPNEKLSCHLCNFITEVQHLLHSHYQQDHYDYFQTRQCKFCNFTTISPTLLGKHLESVHDDKKSIQCEICEKKFFSLLQKNCHIKLQHEKPTNSIICEICGMHIKCNDALQQHLYTHETERKFQCAICPKSFRTRSTLYVHNRTHSEEKSHKCEECGKMYKLKTHLTHHIKTVHEKFKPISCNVCGKKFTMMSQMLRHAVIHTGIKKYKCDTCGKLFNRKHHLKQHLVVHTGEKKHICEVCGKGFTQAHVLRSHMKIHDKEGSNDSL